MSAEALLASDFATLPDIIRAHASERGGKTAQSRQPEDGIDDDAGEAGKEAPQSREADRFQSERQEQQRHGQVQERRVEPSDEEGELGDARAVTEPQERERGQDQVCGDADRECESGRWTIRRWRFG